MYSLGVFPSNSECVAQWVRTQLQELDFYSQSTTDPRMVMGKLFNPLEPG